MTRKTGPDCAVLCNLINRTTNVGAEYCHHSPPFRLFTVTTYNDGDCPKNLRRYISTSCSPELATVSRSQLWSPADIGSNRNVHTCSLGTQSLVYITAQGMFPSWLGMLIKHQGINEDIQVLMRSGVQLTLTV